MPLSGNLYDAIAYPTHPQQALHPDHLAGIGLLHGVACAPVTAARILEIGCGNGANLVPMAAAYPGATFVGLDASGAAIGLAQEFALRCDLKNIRFVAARLEEHPLPEAGFDYVLCHGVYSWVPDSVREALLRVVARCLAPEGIAFISYNALPGWHLRQPVRDLMRWHLRGIDDAAEQMVEAQAFARFLSKAIPDEGAAGRALRAEFATVADRTPQVVWHDELAPEHRAFYLHEFVSAAASHGLVYLADADLIEHLLANLDPQTASSLGAVASDRIELEQYADILVPRRFRQTLLVRSGRTVEAADPGRLATAWFSAGRSLSEAESGPGPVTAVRFEMKGGQSLTTSFGPGIHALRHLMAAAPRRLAFGELVGLIGGEGAWKAADLLRFLFESAAGGAVEWTAFGPGPARLPGERPIALAAARVLAESSSELPTASHRMIQFPDLRTRQLLGLCDGTRTQDQLLLAMNGTRSAESASGDAPIPNREELDALLGHLGKLGFFVG
jgi:SAM-dependent methyltransferase